MWVNTELLLHIMCS